MPANPMERLLQLSQEICNLNNVLSVLAYDQETAMPPKGAKDRAEQLSYLSGQHHARTVAPELGEVCETLWAKKDGLSSQELANVRELRRAHLRAKKMPSEL